MKTMILFSIAMCVLPITTYFMSKAVIFEGIIGLPHQSSYFYAAISSIVVVHIILGLFIYVAFTEDSKPIAEFNKRD
ncbi:hypothetical protein LOTGIDRAFT_209403 [Lottia gigantea]|uniref:Vacuolar ATPase assembly integral membrane protein VMA21 homolog n=1 Tax=Lottia gigantea TaxID=225164 RepID=V4BXP6_LOTGI|nr:hypothetical protein LOTGIDRAFT_209403 [Lottia gigantea]ESO93859.1 hypothetical protein LOTGIDRAFT_209403 [Lottia gigantea]